MKIIGVGDNMVDVYLHQGKMYPGGNSVNVPVLCHKAGADEAAYIGIFGDDVAGKDVYKRQVYGPTVNVDKSGSTRSIISSGKYVAASSARLVSES